MPAFLICSWKIIHADPKKKDSSPFFHFNHRCSTWIGFYIKFLSKLLDDKMSCKLKTNVENQSTKAKGYYVL